MTIREAAIETAKRYLPSGTRVWVVRQQRRYNLHWLESAKSSSAICIGRRQ